MHQRGKAQKQPKAGREVKIKESASHHFHKAGKRRNSLALDATFAAFIRLRVADVFVKIFYGA